MNVLILGSNSFVATGLNNVLEKRFDLDRFSRGKLEKRGNFITGDVFDLKSNPYLASYYDVVLNFIIIKNCGVEENIKFIKEVVAFCKIKTVKRLIHISSTIVYSNNELIVNELSEIESNSKKTGYGQIKIEVDKYLQSLNNLPFKISLIRSGYVIADDRLEPFIKKLPLGLALILGNRKSVLPIVHREDFHYAILNILTMRIDQHVFLFVPNDNKSKYQYAREKYNYRFLWLPKWLIIETTRLLILLRVLPKSFIIRIEGMYIETSYDSTRTLRILKVKF
jgi:nucleoside-diphosphate-sugar epimerase